MRRRGFLLACVIAGVGIAVGPASAQQVQNPTIIRLALVPDENASTIIQNALPLKRYLEQALRRDVELIVTTDYSSMIEAMRFGRIEVAYFGPLSYVLARSKAPGIEPFAVGVSKGSIDTNKVTVLAESDPIPNYPIAMQGYLAPELKAAIKAAFLELNDKEILKTFRAEGFVATDDKAYDILRATAKILDLDLTNFKG